MKFIIDAQLPKHIKTILTEYGYPAIHTLDLPNKNRSSDNEVIAYALAHNCVVLTKDSDFVNSFHLKHEPKKLCLISTGNIKNQELEFLLRSNLLKIIDLLKEYNFIELTRTDIIIHA